MSFDKIRLTGVEEFDLLSLLPPYFQVILDYQELMSTERIELETLWGFIERVWDNLYIQTADEPTLSYYENLLGLVPEEDDDLELRRWRILTTFRRRPPFTLPHLYEFLNESLGIDNYRVDIDYPAYKITITGLVDDLVLFDEVVKVLITLLPAHLEFIHIRENAPSLDTKLYYGSLIYETGRFDIQEYIEPIPTGKTIFYNGSSAYATKNYSLN